VLILNKKIWGRPALVIISRGQTAEAVLSGCKTGGAGGYGGNHGSCQRQTHVFGQDFCTANPCTASVAS